MISFRMVPLACVALMACDQGAPEAAAPPPSPVRTINEAEPGPEEIGRAPVPTAPRAAAAAGPTSAFTSIDPARCRLIAQNKEEAGYSRHRCVGAAGYRLEVTESDLRQNIELIRPDGSKNPLDLASLVAGGGFSSLGKNAEWRGADPQRPRTVTVRYGVNEDPDPAVAPRSYLVVIKLAAPACVVARVSPGPRQSEEAREVADRARLPACPGG